MTDDPRDYRLSRTASTEEWQTRVDLAACYRLVAHYEMTDLIYTHISARLPDQFDHFLLNPFGVMFEEVTASNLLKLDMNGDAVDDSPYEPNPAGFTIHSAVLAVRPDVDCVLHTHTTAGMAVASTECGLLPLTQTSLPFYNRLAYHDYEGPALELDERERLARSLGHERALILRNHGLLTAGRTIAEAFILIHRLESACRAQVAAQHTGEKLRPMSKEVCEQADARMSGRNDPRGDREWPALLRMLDRIDPSFRH